MLLGEVGRISLKSSKERKEQTVPINDGQYWSAKTKYNTTNCS